MSLFFLPLQSVMSKLSLKTVNKHVFIDHLKLSLLYTDYILTCHPYFVRHLSLALEVFYFSHSVYVSSPLGTLGFLPPPAAHQSSNLTVNGVTSCTFVSPPFSAAH